MTDRLLKLPEVAEMTGVSIDTLRWYRHKGEGGPRTFKLGRRVVAMESDVLAWIKEQRDAQGANYDIMKSFY